MLSCSYFNPSVLFKDFNLKQYALFGYFSGVAVGVFLDDLYSNKYEKYYRKFSYQKTLINFWSITGLCSGLYIGYNKNRIA